MAKTRNIPDNALFPSSYRRVIVDTYRGQFRLRGWPRKAGKAKAPALIASQENFRQTVKALKFIAGSQQATAINIAKGTGAYPRDMLMHFLNGGGYDLVDQAGNLIQRSVPMVYPVTFQGARVERTSNVAITANTPTKVTWQSPVLDTAMIWDASVPRRLTVPTAVQIIVLKAGFRSSTTINNVAQIAILNSAGVQIAATTFSVNSNIDAQCDTGPIPVAAGDWFEVQVFSPAGFTLQAVTKTYFSMEIIGT